MAVSREGTQGRTICEGYQMGSRARFESMQRPAFATGLRHGESLGHLVDRDHAAGAHHQRGADGELADRTAAPDRDGVAMLDLRILGGHVAGREDIR
ncbi:hypothetical protein WR25_15810 [Diploscapter pachys]|uniref:Uncharacterized protein n=1 Tax=Diploscapter pachys TaxID=2018661 RepID=A0A2A2JZ69_9BILA|nr:hypothetical protein WR25_15810 [Diploscapter pachys]